MGRHAIGALRQPAEVACLFAYIPKLPKNTRPIQAVAQ
jgi:hypothetical protein